MNNDDNIGIDPREFLEQFERELQSERQQLETNIEQCDYLSGGSEVDSRLRLRKIQKCNSEVYSKLVVQQQDLVRPYLGAIARAEPDPARSYVSRIVTIRDSDHHNRVIEALTAAGDRHVGKLFIVVDEGDHVHYVHDCAFSNRTCRCRWLQSEDVRRNVRPDLRRVKSMGELSTNDYAGIFVYFLVSKWQSFRSLWIGGAVQGLPGSDESIRWKNMCAESERVLAGQAERVRRNSSEGDSAYEFDRESLPAIDEEPPEKRRKTVSTRRPRQSKFSSVCKEITEILNTYFTIPANHIRDIIANDPQYQFLYDPSLEKHYYASCSLFTQQVNDFSLRDFYNFYVNKQPLFYANNLDIGAYYHDMKYSTDIIMKLLQFQCNYDDEVLRSFLQNLVSWFDKKGWNNNPKMNCVCIVGPPNSGKNYFWDTIAALAYNVGHIGRVNNKTNQFALQDTYNRRIVVGNEVSMEDGAKEDFKKLCEGTSFNIRVKFQGDKIFKKAPVCLISNYELIICNDPHFKDVRVKTLNWNTCDLLKESTLRPYPLCIFDILNMYNVEF